MVFFKNIFGFFVALFINQLKGDRKRGETEGGGDIQRRATSWTLILGHCRVDTASVHGVHALQLS